MFAPFDGRQVSVSAAGQKYEVNVLKMTQRNQQTGTVRDVRRVGASRWEYAGGQAAATAHSHEGSAGDLPPTLILI